jgi:hypothetical protein
VPMAPLSTNLDRDFSAGDGEAGSDLHEWMAKPPATLDDLSTIRQYALASES